MVGCVIVSPSGESVGWGYHRQVGGPHAEIIALQRAGTKAKGARLYCTLEPCNHQGKTGPCAQAVIDAGVARVIVAKRDPWPVAAGGLERLAAAGVETRVLDACDFASNISAPFTHRLTTGLPWVTVKWAHTIDGRIATSTGESQWISNEASRRMLHRERGRVDAILTGIGTVLKDDPMLTPRNVRLRRPIQRRPPKGLPLRVVIDPQLRIPLDAKIVTTTDEAPTIIACAQAIVDSSQGDADHKVQLLRSRGVEVLGIPMQDGELPLEPVLRELATKREATHVLVEAGGGVMSRLFQQRLVNEAWVFTAPLLLGDDQARRAISGMTAHQLADGVRMQLWNLRRRGGDMIARYRVE
jgi:diaminohydroxyphosphoribosylaminopyrimidine deaminase/5-amino-6-(5-phosphoribosylamino)uracil reductase